MDIKSKIRVIEDFPKEGISFKDVTTLLKDGEAYSQAVDMCIDLIKDIDYDLIVSPEARGFVVGAPIAYKLAKGFVPIRKPGKLPGETLKYEYSLEYGTDALEIHKDAIYPGCKVIIADDLLATGGTVAAIEKMIKQLGGTVAGYLFLMELEFLNGREKLEGNNIYSLIKY